MEQMQMEPNTMEKRMLRRASAAQRPINGSLELLPLCNMNCDMCYVRLSAGETEAKGGLRMADEWISLGRQMQKAGVLFLLLTGTGDPLGAVLPTAAAAVSGIVLGVLGVVVERWGKLPPDGDGPAEGAEAGS